MPRFTIFTKRYQPVLPDFNEDSPASNDSVMTCDETKTPYIFNLVGFWCYTINIILSCLYLLVLILLVLKVKGIGQLPQPCVQSLASRTFITHLGRDTAYMTLDHQYDKLWEISLAEHLGEFLTPDDPYKRGEYAMYLTRPSRSPVESIYVD
jgi:hypothetical protein